MKLTILVIFVVLLEPVAFSSIIQKSIIRGKRSLRNGYGGRMKRWNSNKDYGPNYSPTWGENYAESPAFSDQERKKLEAMYGADTVRQHYNDFEKVRQMGEYGAHEHKIPWKGIPPNTRVVELDKESKNNAKLSAVNFEPVQPQVIVVDEADSSFRQAPLVADYLYHCNIHGLWMSGVAGVAIELLPVIKDHGRIEIRTKIFDLPDPSSKGILTPQWTGSGMISPESPTTMTILFQEHISESAIPPVANNDLDAKRKLPRTAVFVGQCLVCENDSPVLQGTWTVFQNTQSCAKGKDDSQIGPSNETSGMGAKSSRETLHLFNKSLT